MKKCRYTSGTDFTDERRSFNHKNMNIRKIRA